MIIDASSWHYRAVKFYCNKMDLGAMPSKLSNYLIILLLLLPCALLLYFLISVLFYGMFVMCPIIYVIHNLFAIPVYDAEQWIIVTGYIFTYVDIVIFVGMGLIKIKSIKIFLSKIRNKLFTQISYR